MTGHVGLVFSHGVRPLVYDAVILEGTKTNMTRAMAIVAVSSLCSALCVNLSAAALVDFQTLPANGFIASPPGSTAGWGYSIANGSSTDWLMTISLNTGALTAAVPHHIFDFPILSPGSMVTVPYDPFIGAGLFELIWDTSATAGLANSGSFVLSSQWWTNDPLNGGVFIGNADDVSRDYEAVVDMVVPEPATAWPFLVVTLWFWRRKRRMP